METDPIVAEVREVRRRIFFDECGGDWERFWIRMKEVQKTIPADKLVTKELLEQRRRVPLVVGTPAKSQ